MKTLFAVAILLVSISVFCESKRHDFGKGREYKIDSKPMDFGLKHHHKKMRGAHLNMREGGAISVHDDWMKMPKGTECSKVKCGHKEFCMSNPKTGEEKCISKRNFKESRRLFRSFHKDKKMLKKDKTFDLLDKDLTTADHMKDVYDLLNDYNNFKKHSDKKVHVKSLMEKEQGKFLSEAGVDTVQECRPTELYELRKRLVGWFVLMHTESRRDHHKMRLRKHHKKHGFKHLDRELTIDMKKEDLKKDLRAHHLGKHHLTKRSVHDTVAVHDTVETESHHHCKCSKSAMWEFHKQDTNRNRILSQQELEAMESNKREPCMKPLFKSCDTDSDGALTHGEWCCCLANTIPPCLEKKRVTDAKDWIPRCDKEGYYEREQCHDNSGYCWCVDLNGNEIVGTKNLGKAHCGKYDPNGHLDKQ